MGELDHRVDVPKHHVYEFARRVRAQRLVGPRGRALLGRIAPSLRGAEWRLPRWLGSRRALREARPVLKLVQVPAWGTWVLRNRPGTRVLHIVRRPAGFLNSWRNRYLDEHERAVVTLANRQRLRAVVAVDPKWAERLGPIEHVLEGSAMQDWWNLDG
jgi:hypothetical protein